MDFIPTLPTYANDISSQSVWGWFERRLDGEEGLAYYKYPNVGSPNTPEPDLTIFCRNFQPLVLKCLNIQINQIVVIGQDSWTIRTREAEEGEDIDSPLLQIED